MNILFLKILNMSIAASWLILALVLLRPLLKRAPKWLTCLLWSLAGFRLLFPFSIKSVLSLIPSAQTVKPDILFDPIPQIHSGIPAFNQWVNPVIGEALAPAPAASVNPMQVWTRFAAYVWLAGILVLLFYALFSYVRLRKRVEASIQVEDGVRISDEIDSPFILGLIKPRIYLPSGMETRQQTLVLTHERAHLARRDHWWKPLGFLILTLYWFNPLSWLAYLLLCRDIEMACDEKVIRSMDKEDRLVYSHTLLATSISHRSVMACPLAFGELAVKERIRKILNYKKPAFWVILLALIASLVLIICFLTNPKEPVEEVTEPTGSHPGTVFEPGLAEEWFDYLYLNSMDWEDRLETSRPEFPGMTFRWTPGEVEAVTQTRSETLFQGMPIWNSYFCDLTGDCKPELCATVSFGSGIVDNHVVVFDYANKEIHYLWNRFVHDYELYLEEDRLYVAKRPHMGEEILESGRLIFQEGRPAMEGETDPPEDFSFEGPFDTYRFDGSGPEDEAVLQLNSEGGFLLSPSPLSSYLAHGHYRLEGRQLILQTWGGLYTYTFDRQADGWCFIADLSSPLYTGLSSLADGSLFRLVEKEPQHGQTLGDWWNDDHEKEMKVRSLQISEYQYDDQSIATKTAFRTVQDRDLAESWFALFMDLPIREIKTPENLTGKRSLLELSFQDSRGKELIFISLQIIDDGSDSVFVNGSFISPTEVIPENIFLIEDMTAMQMFKDLKLLFEG